MGNRCCDLGVAVGLLGIWSRLGEKTEAALHRKPLVTEATGDFGVGGGSGAPPGGASDLDQALPPGDPWSPKLLLLVSFFWWGN